MSASMHNTLLFCFKFTAANQVKINVQDKRLGVGCVDVKYVEHGAQKAHVH